MGMDDASTMFGFIHIFYILFISLYFYLFFLDTELSKDVLILVKVKLTIKQQNSYTRRNFTSPSYVASLRFSNHHSNFLHGVLDTFPGIPVDPFAISSVPIFPVKVCPVTCVIPPRSMIFCCTVAPRFIVAVVVCGEVHSVMLPHAVFWNTE